MTEAEDPTTMTGGSNLEPERRTGKDRSSVVVLDEARNPVGVQSKTPVRILSQLLQNPGPPPVGFTVLDGEDITISVLNRGDALGIDGRWCPVVSCTSVNGWVSVETPEGYPALSAAFMDVHVYLARVIDVEGVTV